MAWAQLCLAGLGWNGLGWPDLGWIRLDSAGLGLTGSAELVRLDSAGLDKAELG